MGHDVRYYGKLTAKQPLNSQEVELFKSLKETEDYLYALKYELFVKETEADTISITGHFTFDKDCEKIYPEPFYNSIEKYVKILKEGGNDLVDGSHLVSSSEYGIDDEAIVLVYRDGSFTQKKITDLVENYVSNKDILFAALEKSELEIKNIGPELSKHFFSIYNDSYKELAIDKKLKILTEYARVIDKYYLEIANACELTMELKLKKPSIFLNNLVKTLLDKRNPKKYYHTLNEKLADLGIEELPCYAIKECETVMQKFIAMFPADYHN